MTTDDLRRRVAELEGWTDVYPNGGDPNVDTQWLGIKPPDRHESYLPDWLTDANAAMELVDKMNADKSHQGVCLLYDAERNEWKAVVDTLGWSDESDQMETDPDIKVAICRLYVAWRESKR